MPGIHVFDCAALPYVEGRDKPGHDQHKAVRIIFGL
jgi:hypothetical protein